MPEIFFTPSGPPGRFRVRVKFGIRLTIVPGDLRFIRERPGLRSLIMKMIWKRGRNMKPKLDRCIVILALAAGLVLVLAGAFGSPQKQAAASSPAGEGDVVKDAFDTDETTGVPAPRSAAEVEAARKAYSPFAGKKYPMRVYFGDTHHHTANSGDGYMAGNNPEPRAGLPVRARGGGDLVHGRAREALAAARLPRHLGPRRGPRHHVPGGPGQPAFTADPQAAKWSKVLKEGTPEERAATQGDVVKAQAMGTLPRSSRTEGGGPNHEVRLAGVHGHGGEVQRAGPLHGDDRLRVDLGAGRQQPAPQRPLPRRQGQADQVFPFSAWNSEDPEKLWEWMASYEKKTGGS